MLDRIISCLVSLTLAVLVWMYARSRDQEMLDNVPVPVEISLAPGQAEQYDLEATGPCQVLASFTGPPSRLRELRGWLHRGELRVQKSLAVPEACQNEPRYSDTVRIDASDLHPPPGVRIMVLEERNRIPVTLRKLVERRLPVRLDHASEERVGQVTLEPAAVLVRGPQEVLDRIRFIPTQPFTLASPGEAPTLQEVHTAGMVPLVQELEGRPVRATPCVVAVRLTLRPRQKVYEVRDVPVHFLCPANFPLRPQWQNERAGRINLRLIGPAAEEAPSVTAYIDLTAGKFEPGQYADEPLRLQLPKDFQLAQNPPRSAAFRLIAPPLPRSGAVGFDEGTNP
jgi:hypothetical protein